MRWESVFSLPMKLKYFVTNIVPRTLTSKSCHQILGSAVANGWSPLPRRPALLTRMSMIGYFAAMVAKATLTLQLRFRLPLPSGLGQYTRYLN